MSIVKTVLEWINVEVAQLPSVRQSQFAEMKRIYKDYQAAKQAFEDGMNEDYADSLGADQCIVFGYRFGKLSVAVAPRETKRVASAKPAVSLSAFLATQSAGGRRA